MIATRVCGDEIGRVVLSRQPSADFADFTAVSRAQRGDYPSTRFLLAKYRGVVWNKARSFYLTGAESEDLVQVGMIGLWHAITDYKAERCRSFSSFAKLCIANHMISAVQSSTRHKQTPLNSSVSLDCSLGDDTPDSSLADLIADTGACPEKALIQSEDTRALRLRLLELLSDFEWRVLSAYKVGKSYKEIARELVCNTKSIDNALTRIKHKVTDLPLGFADLSSVL